MFYVVGCNLDLMAFGVMHGRKNDMKKAIEIETLKILQLIIILVSRTNKQTFKNRMLQFFLEQMTVLFNIIQGKKSLKLSHWAMKTNIKL